jgi:hypothetical protein
MGTSNVHCRDGQNTRLQCSRYERPTPQTDLDRVAARVGGHGGWRQEVGQQPHLLVRVVRLPSIRPHPSRKHAHIPMGIHPSAAHAVRRTPPIEAHTDAHTHTPTRHTPVRSWHTRTGTHRTNPRTRRGVAAASQVARPRSTKKDFQQKTTEPTRKEGQWDTVTHSGGWLEGSKQNALPAPPSPAGRRPRCRPC